MNCVQHSKASFICAFCVTAFAFLGSGANCAAQETYQQFLRLLQIPGQLEVGIETSWIDAPLDAKGLINYYDKANELLGQHSVNYEDIAVPIIYDAFGSLNQPEEFWHRLGRRPPAETDKFIHWWK